jgi:ATP-dependent helicase/nuclease subunit B
VPSRQRAEAARLALARAARSRGQRVWATPDILPFEIWLTREIDARARTDALPRLLSSAQDWLLWRQCTAQFTAQLELIARGALAEGLRRAEQLAGEYLIPVAAPEAAAGAEGRLLYEVRRAVKERCAAARVTSARALAAELLVVGNERPVEFAGYLSLPPFLQRIAHARRSQGFATNARAAADPVRRAQIVAAVNQTEELERIAAWSSELLRTRPEARILIVLPGAPGERERLATLLRQGLDPAAAAQGERGRGVSLVAIEGGEPLARAPLVAHALSTIAVLTRATDFESVSTWLCAPYWREPDATARARIDLVLRRMQRLELDLPALLALLTSGAATRQATTAAAARQLAAQLAAAAAQLASATRAPREWAVRIRGALDALHFPGERARSSHEEQSLARFNELLDEFGELAVAARSMTREQALQTFSELAMRAAFRPASGDALVTVTARLEDPLIHYDGIWVAGLDAGAWPAPLQLNPFLSAAAQRAAGIPAASATGRTAEARALMRAWRAAADELVLSFPYRAEDLQLAPSPLLAEWTHATASPNTVPFVWLPARLHREGVLESFADATAPAWPSGEPLPSGTRVLELQSLCAFRACAELRLGSAPLDSPAPGITPQERGQLIHAALEALWKVLKDSQSLQELSADDLHGLIGRSVSHAALVRWGDLATPAQHREQRRAALLIGTLCELERGRAHFRVRDVEHELSVLLAGAQLHVRIDRIDALADGGLAILDYKSGAHKTMDWYGEHLSHPQLLAYLAAVGADVRALATVSVAAREVRFDGIGSHANLLPTLKAAEAREELQGVDPWAASREFWRVRIETLARDFLAGNAVVDPAPHACKYCAIASLCRIADQAVQSDVGEALDD